MKGKKARKKKSRAKRRRRAKRRSNKSKPVAQDPVARMMMDPCGSTLDHGFYPTAKGMVARTKTDICPSSSTDNCGYLLWSPEFSGGFASGGISATNAWLWSSDNIATRPTNTTAAPFGNGGTSTTHVNLGKDAFLSSSTVSDARTITSCIRMTYMGALQSAKGMIAYVDGLPLDNILFGGATANTPLNVQELFQTASRTGRLTAETMEIRRHPNVKVGQFFRDETIGALEVQAGVATKVATAAEGQGATVYGFVWRNVTANNELDFSCTEGFEWRPEAPAGFVSAIPRQVAEPGYTQSIINALDSMYPGWTTKAANVAGTAVMQMASAMFTGSIPNDNGWLSIEEVKTPF